jgi:hypothetical protein
MGTSRQEENRLWQHKAALAARPQAPVAEPMLFDYLPMVAPAIEPDARSAPVAQPVEATAPAAAAPVAAPAADAPAVELPPGWPADLAAPDWWTEFLSIKGSIEVLAARRQQCGDLGCGYPVSIQWEAPGYPRQWSCPRCGRAAAPVADPPEAQQPAALWHLQP